MKQLTSIAAGVLVMVMARPVLADEPADDIDVRAFEYVDVVETTDGSIVKGIVVEQQPGTRYKVATADGSVHVIKADDVVRLTKQRNKLYRGHPTAMRAGDAGDGVSARYDRDALPQPLTQTGPRAEIELAAVLPRGDIKMFDTSFAPTFRLGYTHMAGNFGITGGGMTRFTYWMIPGDTGDAVWTLETHAFVRAALHIGRAAPYAGLTLGPDINYVWIDSVERSDTQVGLGVNVGGGVSIAATPTVEIDLGIDFHPATDVVGPEENASIQYLAFRFGSAFRW